MKQTLRQFIVGVLMGGLILEFVVRALSPVLGPPLESWNTMQDAKLYLLQTLPRNQIPENFVFGNSAALIGINPYLIENSRNLRVFNAAMNGSDSYSMTRLAIDEIIPIYQPKRLYFFLSQGSFREDIDASRTSYELARKDKRRLGIVNEVISKFYVYRYRNTIRDPMTINTLVQSMLHISTGYGIVQSWVSDLDEYGYSRLPQSANKILGGWAHPPKSSKEFSVSELPQGTLADFQTLRKFALRQKIKITLVTVPTITFDHEYRERSEELASKLGFDFIQGNDVIRDGRYFQDSVHLNSIGAEKFSLWFAGKMVESDIKG